MFVQTFNLTDIPQLVALCFIEILMSVDNTIILAVLVQSLPQTLRRKALFIGISSAFLLRLVAILFVSFILSSNWLKLLGAGYLFFLSFHHFFKKIGPQTILTPTPSFWKTVLLIEFFDLAFAIDSIIAGVAFIATPIPLNGLFPPKLWIVYIGGMIGLIAIRYSAGLFSELLERFPRMKDSAYLLVGWIALKLALDVISPAIPHFEIYFWLGFLVIFFSGFLKVKSIKR